MSSNLAIVAEGLHKRYGKLSALDGLDLVAEAGSVLGVLGPNGAGKTTAVRILTTLLKPDGGRAEVAGFDVVRNAAAVRAHIGLTGQYAAVDEILTGYENLNRFSPETPTRSVRSSICTRAAIGVGPKSFHSARFGPRATCTMTPNSASMRRN